MKGEQARVNDGDGYTYRWFVDIATKNGRRRIATWAPTADAAKAKAEKREVVLRVFRVTPAPSAIDSL